MADERIVSLNIGSQQVSGAVFSRLPGGGLRLDRVERTEYYGDPSEDELRRSQALAALKEVVANLKLKGSKIRYVISSFPVLTKFASLPALDGERVDQIVEFEAQQQVPYPINEVVWGYQLMGEPGDIEVEVMLAAVKADELGEIDAIVSEAGLVSQGAEISPVALYNALRFNYPDLEGATVLVDIGARTTDIIFMEGARIFVRTVKIGGSDITRAMNKENFGANFTAADLKKINVGFVALGGAYADHEDPEIAGISKVVRNSLTRLHSEVMRTITFYRSQQHGGAPGMMLLSGATAGLPFIREFFAEKLNLPVDHFNPFRNVTVSSGANRELVTSQAHALGDLVGSALSQVGPVPVELTLIPPAVEASRALDKRKPALMLAVAGLVLFLGALGFYFSRAASVAVAHTSKIDERAADLRNYNAKIEDLKSDILAIDKRKSPYVDAVRNRVYWVEVFNYLNSHFQNDLVFLTLLQPLSAGQPIIAEESDALLAGPSAGESIIDAFAIEGLWRENARGSRVVYEYFQSLKDDSLVEGANPFFNLKDIDIAEAAKVDPGTSGDRFAYPFQMALPLPEGNQVKYTK
jgi:type IV pilus assembly protein PilM